MRAATYARLSDEGLSIPDQQKTARKYAEDHGWRVVAEFKDEHRSAFKMIERKGFEALLQAASDGKIGSCATQRPTADFSRSAFDATFQSTSTAAAGFSICQRRKAALWE